MMIAYLIVSLALAGAMAAVRGRMAVKALGWTFYALQAAAAGYAAAMKPEAGVFFHFDAPGMLFFGLMAVIAPLAFWSGISYLDSESDRQFKLYNLFLVLLCTAISGVYFADNLAVTWIFMEATTLAAAGLVYHRRTAKSLEATWKYLFVCSTGIAVAYLGILLLSTAATDGDLTYANLVGAVSAGNPLYMKIAFLFLLVGYSCKMEVFPLYTVGVDANQSVPAPASALLSTALVNAGFLAVFRVYKLFVHSPVMPWASHVLIVAGVVSVLVGVLFMRRANHYKRFFAYSTVENMGIVLIGLGIGGVGVFAALLHLTAHALIKSGLFLQIARVGKMYGTYRINRIGGYMQADALGAVTMLALTVLVLAFPPSPLFMSEVMILGQVIAAGKWWLAAIVVLMVCVVIYNFFSRTLRLCYKTSGAQPQPVERTAARWIPLALLLAAAALGVWQGGEFVEFLNTIVR